MSYLGVNNTWNWLTKPVYAYSYCISAFYETEEIRQLEILSKKKEHFITDDTILPNQPIASTPPPSKSHASDDIISTKKTRHTGMINLPLTVIWFQGSVFSFPRT